MPEKIPLSEFLVDSDHDGVRLDRFLRNRFKSVPLSLIHRTIRKRKIRVNGKPVDGAHRIREGDSIVFPEFTFEDQGESQVGRDRLVRPLDPSLVLFEDEAVLVFNKPAGLVVHAGTGHRSATTLIDRAGEYLRQRGDSREPVLVHRLDKDTSGVFVMAKGKQIARTLNTHFAERTVRKWYTALSHGKPPSDSGTIELQLEKVYNRNRGMKTRVADQGALSRTEYSLVSFRKGLSCISAEILTGKTHQLRVHLAHLGCPIVGDSRYGDEARDREFFAGNKVPKRLFLHAHSISLPHPITGEILNLKAPHPPEFTGFIS